MKRLILINRVKDTFITIDIVVEDVVGKKSGYFK